MLNATHTIARFVTVLTAVCMALICSTGVAAQNAHPPTSAPSTMPPAAPATLPDDSAFVEAVNLDAIGAMAVHYEGRIKSFDSFASQMMQLVTGPQKVNGQSPAFTYLDMMFRPEKYEVTPFIYVKKKPVRAQIAEAIRSDPIGSTEPGIDQAMETFVETGLLLPRHLNLTNVAVLMNRLNSDLIKTAKFVQAIQTALNVSDITTMYGLVRFVPPSSGDFESTQWLNLFDISNEQPGGRAAEVEPAMRADILQAFGDLRDAWRVQDVAGVEAAESQIAGLVRQINPEFYPSTSRLQWESTYFRLKNLVWIWIFYALALVPLVLAAVFRWNGARIVGLLMFLGAFGLHTFAIGLRWYVAERWPNSNMFEAVTTAAWFGGCGAVALELWARKTPMRNIFALGSAVSSMVALMCAHFMPLALNANISNMMPVLHDVWLYIHTNVIIFSYCLIFMAAVSAVLYLMRRAVLLMQGRPGVSEYAKVGGAASLIMTSPDGSSYLAKEKTTLGQVFDGTTMILMELSFIMLWAGLVMGAIWADHSWGRPWGWDPKEVFALNTFIIFAILIHVRLKVRDKGLWTAALAIVGALVMLFNWIFINFFIVGLHSYA